jgi:hypothetical protein
MALDGRKRAKIERLCGLIGWAAALTVLIP